MNPFKQRLLFSCVHHQQTQTHTLYIRYRILIYLYQFNIYYLFDLNYYFHHHSSSFSFPIMSFNFAFIDFRYLLIIMFFIYTKVALYYSIESKWKRLEVTLFILMKNQMYQPMVGISTKLTPKNIIKSCLFIYY